MYLVVDVVGLHDPLHVVAPGRVFDLDAAMHDNIVKNKIRHAVQRNAEADPHQKTPRGYLWPHYDEYRGADTEDDTEPVVALPPVLVMHMVRLVPAPHDAVHDVLVGEPGEALHKQEGTQHEYDIED